MRLLTTTNLTITQTPAELIFHLVRNPGTLLRATPLGVCLAAGFTWQRTHQLPWLVFASFCFILFVLAVRRSHAQSLTVTAQGLIAQTNVGHRHVAIARHELSDICYLPAGEEALKNESNPSAHNGLWANANSSPALLMDTLTMDQAATILDRIHTRFPTIRISPAPMEPQPPTPPSPPALN